MNNIVCVKCEKKKPETDFNFANKKHGVRQVVCRKCFSEYNRERYLANKDKIKADVKAYREANPENVYRSRLKTYKKNGTRKNLYRLIDAALKAGVIEKPETCEVCGMKPEKRIEAHHNDYTKPLEIIWCCPICHSELDISRRRASGEKYYSAVKPVRCIETGKAYESIILAAKEAGIKPNTLSQCLSGRSKTAGGYHWERL